MNNAFLLGVIAPAMCAYFAFAEPDASPEVLRPPAPPCDLGGKPVAVADYMLTNVTISDRLVRHGSLRGRGVPREDVVRAAEDYARAQPYPGTTLALFMQCLPPDAKTRYPVGYEIIAEALYREAQRRQSQ